MLKQKIWLFAFLLIMFCPIVLDFSSAAESKKFSTYNGAWFQIQYPSTFTVVPSIKSKTNTDGYDSVFFVSPDKKVEYYVFSPQWGGEAPDISIKNDEALVSEKSTKAKGTTNRAYTIKAKDNNYFRSYVDVINSEANTRQIIGIKYTDQVSYKKYRNDYLKFKKSLVQLGD